MALINCPECGQGISDEARACPACGSWDRLVGIGDVTISTAATVEGAEVARGVAQPGRIRDLLISRRQQEPAALPVA